VRSGSGTVPRGGNSRAVRMRVHAGPPTGRDGCGRAPGSGGLPHPPFEAPDDGALRATSPVWRGGETAGPDGLAYDREPMRPLRRPETAGERPGTTAAGHGVSPDSDVPESGATHAHLLQHSGVPAPGRLAGGHESGGAVATPAPARHRLRRPGWVPCASLWCPGGRSRPRRAGTGGAPEAPAMPAVCGL